MLNARRALLAAALLVGCNGPIRIDYEAATNRTAEPGRDLLQEIPFRRLALSAPGSLERRLWERVLQATDLANRFIESDANHHFPPGRRFRATDDGKIYLDSDAGDGFRLHVNVSSMGTLVTQMGYSAQETVDGFSVGAFQDARGRPVDAAIANSLFFRLDGKWRPPEMIAALMVHETSHTLQVRAQGQVSYWLEYYLRAAVLVQGGEEQNQLEKVPYRVEAEFWRWLAERS